MSAHTPGPWEYDDVDGVVFVVRGDADTDICTMPVEEAETSREQVIHANARLIAAAPELLALARLVVTATDEDENGDMPDHPRGTLLTLRRAARAAIAIAKAEGK